MSRDKHEFYEIVQNYYRARNHLASAEHDIEVLRRESSKHQDLVWETLTQTMVLQVGGQDNVYLIGILQMVSNWGWLLLQIIH